MKKLRRWDFSSLALRLLGQPTSPMVIGEDAAITGIPYYLSTLNPAIGAHFGSLFLASTVSVSDMRSRRELFSPGLCDSVARMPGRDR
jgi:hypothetical protein